MVFLHISFDFILRMLVPNIIYIIIYLLYPITYIIVLKHQYNFILKNFIIDCSLRDHCQFPPRVIELEYLA